jgi:hypothetical protein
MKTYSSVIVHSLSVTESTPLTGDGSIRMSFVQLDILDRVSKTLLVDSSASDYVGMHFHNGQAVN